MCLDGWYLALYHHCHIDNFVYDDLVHIFSRLEVRGQIICSTVRCFLWDQSHNFNDFLNDGGAHRLDLKSDHKSSTNT